MGSKGLGEIANVGFAAARSCKTQSIMLPKGKARENELRALPHYS
jgi:hypothetical protein